MSRSYKKHPVFAISGSGSKKWQKSKINSIFRAKNKITCKDIVQQYNNYMDQYFWDDWSPYGASVDFLQFYSNDIIYDPKEITSLSGFMCDGKWYYTQDDIDFFFDSKEDFKKAMFK